MIRDVSDAGPWWKQDSVGVWQKVGRNSWPGAREGVSSCGGVLVVFRLHQYTRWGPPCQCLCTASGTGHNIPAYAGLILTSGIFVSLQTIFFFVHQSLVIPSSGFSNDGLMAVISLCHWDPFPSTSNLSKRGHGSHGGEEKQVGVKAFKVLSNM